MIKKSPNITTTDSAKDAARNDSNQSTINKKSQNTTGTDSAKNSAKNPAKFSGRNFRQYFPAVIALTLLLLLWQLITTGTLVPDYMLPSPIDVLHALYADRSLLLQHSLITLEEAFIGLTLGVLTGFTFAMLMDTFDLLYRAFYPLLVISQTIPTVAIAPLLVLWFGYDILPKVILIILATFFPITVGLLDGFRAVDTDAVAMLRSMGADKWQIFRYIKFPASLPQFFSGLRIAAAYSIVGAVISEWLGGFGGLGVYMTRVKKAFAFDKMFAVILLISVISLLLIALINLLEKKAMPYRHPANSPTQQNSGQNLP